MGCCSSNVFHDEEKGLEDHFFPYLDYQEQPDDEYKQLDTENDQKGDTAVEHIFKKTKMVYGQPPKDMRNFHIDWKNEYHIDFKNRPCPYDFPAFEGDKPPDYDENKEEMNKIDTIDKDKSRREGGRKRKSKSKDGKKKSGGKEGAKNFAKITSKKAKHSTNELDQCSISEKD
ncbi:hypothetical protein LOAG_06410 [Loa loa]|uniref:Uncharacterized protein n=1 Tax=Loa loa TaxID=7209 RepID=A0A1I7VUF3_LOALO|nr:hypothetical protein LOAG_06410 [Loa loa]EFO22074.1 hypothetical protein LOAG_06410 [Loa loa]